MPWPRAKAKPPVVKINKEVFSAKVQAARISRGWTQDALGRKLRVTGRTVSNWELGNVAPQLRFRKKIEKLLKVKP